MSYLVESLVAAHRANEIDGIEYFEKKLAQVEELCELKVAEAMELYNALLEERDEFVRALNKRA